MLAIGTLIEAPPGFVEQQLSRPEFANPAYAKFLKGVRICLDPGHGGDGRQRGYKRGPTGVREAEINLRVALYLEALLARAGAKVRLTRDQDEEVTLAERAATANEWPADLLVSLHHNASESSPQANHTTVWYHGEVDFRPANLDLARYLCDGLYDSLSLPQIADVPLKSDHLMYPNGFGVLRQTEVAAALVETSFFSNPEEEQRLRTPEWNFREAYGLFQGLARYAASGLPRARLLDPPDAIVRRSGDQPGSRRLERPLAFGSPEGDSRLAADESNIAAGAADASEAPVGAADAAEDPDRASPTRPAGAALVFELDDGLRGRKAWGWQRQMILADTIAVRLDGQRVPFWFDGATYRLSVTLPGDLPAGMHAVEVQFQNMNKNSVLNPRFRVEVR